LNFCADFLNFKREQKSITGNRYIPQKSGPSPYQSILLLKILKEQKHSDQSGDELDLSVFKDSEKKSLSDICEMYLKDQKCLSILQNENACLDTNDFSYISYNHAKDLSLLCDL
jgi:hypothetical protein